MQQKLTTTLQRQRMLSQQKRLESSVVPASEILQLLDSDRFMSKSETRLFTGLSIRTLDAADDLPRYQPVKRKILFRRSEVIEWMRRHAVGKSADPILNRVLSDLKRGAK